MALGSKCRWEAALQGQRSPHCPWTVGDCVASLPQETLLCPETKPLLRHLRCRPKRKTESLTVSKPSLFLFKIHSLYSVPTVLLSVQGPIFSRLSDCLWWVFGSDNPALLQTPECQRQQSRAMKSLCHSSPVISFCPISTHHSFF